MEDPRPETPPRRLPEAEDPCDSDEWAEWYRMTPAERWRESMRLWEVCLSLGGSLDPEPDTQSPLFDPDEPGAVPIDGGTGLRVLRRGGGV